MDYSETVEQPGAGTQHTRLRQYESILYSLRSGVVILEAGLNGRSETLRVVTVNQQGAEFFGSSGEIGIDTLDDAAL